MSVVELETIAGVDRLRQALNLMAARRVVEDEIERLICLLDRMDAAGEDREPDGEDEIMSEDDGVVRTWFRCGVQA